MFLSSVSISSASSYLVTGCLSVTGMPRTGFFFSVPPYRSTYIAAFELFGSTPSSSMRYWR